MYGKYLDNVRKMQPMIHSITNYVTANDVANMLFACGAAPCMADDVNEVKDIVMLSSGLTVNLGTLNKDRFEAMVVAATAAIRSGKPIVFDPVGAGSSESRTASAKQFLFLSKPTVIRGNLSEIKVLAEIQSSDRPVFRGLTRGVDSPISDFKDSLRSAVTLSKKTGAVTVVTGESDLITDGKTLVCVSNGDPLLKKITGSGCMMSAVITAFISANPDNLLEAVTAAVCAIGICGETARERMTKEDGNATFRNYFIDAMYNLDGDTLDSKAKVSIKGAQDEDK